MSNAILRALAAGGRPGDKVASALCRLISDGAQLGELEPYEFRDPATGEIKLGKRPPLHWLERLAKAIETHAIDRLSVERTVEIILRGER